MQMTITFDYLTLRHAIRLTADETPFRVTMSQLAPIWFCTPRNAKLYMF
ncbi:hypothetical protein [Brevibacillus reuszeri]